MSLACDVFSYGMVLLEILTHRLPFAEITELQVAGKIMNGEVILPLQYTIIYSSVLSVRI